MKNFATVETIGLIAVFAGLVCPIERSAKFTKISSSAKGRSDVTLPVTS